MGKKHSLRCRSTRLSKWTTLQLHMKSTLFHCLLFLWRGRNGWRLIDKAGKVSFFRLKILSVWIWNHMCDICDQKFPLMGISFSPQYLSTRMQPWASLVVQWLRICLPMLGTRVRALVWEDPTCREATRPVSHNYWAANGILSFFFFNK